MMQITVVDFFNNIEHIFKAVVFVYPWFLPLVMIVLGGVFGSFLTCMVYRIPRKISPSFPASYCPSCKHKLKIVDLIPVISWLIFKGKCRKCKTAIPFRYIAIELLVICWGLLCLFFVGQFMPLFLLFISGVGFIFVILCLLMEKTFTPKVLLFSCILLTLFVFSVFW